MPDLDLNGMDVRVIEFHRRRGDVDPSAHQAYLESLEDCAEEGVTSDVLFTTPWANRSDEDDDSDEA